ncbi:16S rRNA (guanine(527)-N(7))-methyltransferase RsmG [Treponema sp. R6D11]
MDGKNLLAEGIDILCKSDEEIKNLIVPCREKIIALLNNYIKEIELFNSAYGLVGANDTNELIIKHILDSLAPLGTIIKLIKNIHTENTPQIADAGSGAGLPGIPLAIALPQCNFTLIERMGRRAGFLFNTKAVLSLSNINVEESELEKAGSGRFNLVTFRAFKPLETKLLKTLFKICAPGGVIAAYKGRREKIKAEMSPLEKNCKNWEIIPCKTPFLEEERHLLVIRPSD